MWASLLALLATAEALRAPPSLAARQHAADAAAKALGGNPIDLSVPSMSAATMPPSMAGAMPPSMVAGGAAQETYDGVRIGPPPDLASLLLHNRIVYLGMPMVSAVTELIVAELLYLNYESPSKPVTLYINSPGTVNAQGQAVGFETEAFAIADCKSSAQIKLSRVHRCPLDGVAMGSQRTRLTGRFMHRYEIHQAACTNHMCWASVRRRGDAPRAGREGQALLPAERVDHAPPAPVASEGPGLGHRHSGEGSDGQ